MSDTIPQLELQPAIVEDPRWALVERIVSSASFVKSPRLCSILLYICELSLRGRNDEINELNIGAGVFGRSRNYDPSVDGIVRSHASRLRQKLEQYFTEEGIHETMRLSIPKGGYVPAFEPRGPLWSIEETGPSVLSATANELDPPPPSTPMPVAEDFDRRVIWVLSVALLLACGCIAYLLASARSDPRAAPFITKEHPLWRNFFSHDRPTMVICSDTGLTILENLTGSPVNLTDYLSGNYRTHIDSPAGTTVQTVQTIAEHRYTSIVDTEIVARLYRTAGPSTNGIEVRYSRDVRPNDLKAGPVILLGTQEGTPWVELFEDQMNFRVQHNHQWGSFSIINRSPRDKELPRYESDRADPEHKIYGIVALRPNLAGSGQVLILEGTSMAGTESAADFVFDDARLLPFLQRIRKPDGSIPFFEILLQSSNMNGNASHSEVMGYRVSPE
ncbi:Adenylate cyclase [Acidisarcina polymorpha]|uniref:Adenylate cyclase n=1 Tax=Acidisarcina polymorpha TaxID=2211140 RepID=A0A2Z5FWW7_9BACT|nr:hypothetical protein [Acidisarcina polymorpha]AXC11252.1 Adenylate cyclase [Acidisarcina polymorpha]